MLILFFELNKDRKFPVTDIIRRSPRFDQKYANSTIINARGYTPEPDIFHDIQGHIPLLMNKKYADFIWEIGVLGYKIVKDERGLGPDLVYHNLKRLQNFSWWTYEYGLLKNNSEINKFRRTDNDIPYQIYGAGIISSYDETINVIDCAKGKSKQSKFIDNGSNIKDDSNLNVKKEDKEINHKEEESMKSEKIQSEAN